MFSKVLYTFKALEPEYTNSNMSYRKGFFEHSLNPTLSYQWLDINPYYIQKRHNLKESLVLLHLKNKTYIILIITINMYRTPKKNPFTILFSHSNTIALGQAFPFIIDLSLNLKCDVISYDYSGYGYSQGILTENELNKDIEEVYYFTNSILEILPNQLLVMGKSFGSVPTIHLASLSNNSDLRGMILESPIASAFSINKKNIGTNEEIFCNRKKIGNVSCPIFFIHGKEDTTIPIEHSYKLSKNKENQYTWYPKQVTNSNLMTVKRAQFYQRLLKFQDYLSRFNTKKFTKPSTGISSSQKNLSKKGVKTILFESKITEVSEKNCESLIVQMNNRPRFSIKKLDTYELNVDESNSDTDNDNKNSDF